MVRNADISHKDVNMSVRVFLENPLHSFGKNHSISFVFFYSMIKCSIAEHFKRGNDKMRKE